MILTIKVQRLLKRRQICTYFHGWINKSVQFLKSTLKLNKWVHFSHIYLMIRWGYRSMMRGMLKSGWGRGARNNSWSGAISVSGRCRSRCIAGRGHGIRAPRGVIRRLLLPSGCVMIRCGGPWTFTCRQFLASWNKQLKNMMLLNIFER